MFSTLGLFGVTLLISAVPLGIKSNNRLRLYNRAQAWPKVSATIVKSSVRESTDSDGTSFIPEFSYRYSVDGTEYFSSQHSEGLSFPNTEDAARQMVRSLPVGSIVDIAVSPTDPKFAILDTGYPKIWQILFRASIVFFVMGAAIFFHEVLIPK
jgi:hypothetical protein